MPESTKMGKAMLVLGAVLALWFFLILGINLSQVFGPAVPDPYLYASIALPVALFAAGYLLIGWFRLFVLSLDLRLLTIVQSWRVVGAGFFFL